MRQLLHNVTFIINCDVFYKFGRYKNKIKRSKNQVQNQKKTMSVCSNAKVRVRYQKRELEIKNTISKLKVRFQN